MTTLVSRKEWGARPRRTGSTSISKAPSVTIHWEGAGNNFPWDHASCDNMMRSIQNYHMDGRGWSDIAYNYVACPHDYLFEGRGYDRRSSANGQDSWNFESFAICALWGSNSGKVPNALKKAINWGINYLRNNGNATSVVKGHRDWHSTDCPGDELYAWIKAGRPVASEGEQDMTTDASVRQIIREEIAASVEDGGVLHEMVQGYAAFGALHTDQVEAGTAGDVDNALKDDFLSVKNQLADVKGLVAELEDLVRTLLIPKP